MNNKMKLKTTFSNLLFFCGLFFMGFEKIVYEGSYIRFLFPDFMEAFFKYSALMFFLGSIATKRRRAKYIIFEMVGFVLMFSLSIAVNNTYLILLIVALFASQNIPFNDIVKACMNMVIAFMLLVVIFSLIGIIPDVQFERQNSIAHSMGYFYYSNLSYQIFFYFVSYLYIKNEKKNQWLRCCLFLLVNFLVYLLTTLRLTFYFSILFIISIYVIKHIDFNKKKWKFFSIFCYPGMAVLSILIASMYMSKNTLIEKVNFVLLNRIKLSYWALVNYGISLFGKHIETQTAKTVDGVIDYSTYFYVDSGYIFTLIEYGILVFLIIILIYSVITCYSLEVKNKYLFIWAIMTCFMSLINNMLNNVVVNPLIFLLPSAIDYYKNSKGKRIKIKKKTTF